MRMSKGRGRRLAAAAAWAIATALAMLAPAEAAHAGAVSVAVEGNALVARGADGRASWRYWLPRDSTPQSAHFERDGSVRLGDGVRIDHDGRPMRRGVAVASTAASRLSWDDPVDLGDGNDNVNGPVFDGQGNGYALAYRYDFESPNQVPVYVYRSQGATASWTTLPPLSVPVASVFRPIVAVDAAGDITVVYRMADNYELHAERYVPGTGWQPPVVLYPGTEYMQEFASAVDADGNVTVLAGIGGGDTLTLLSYRYLIASASWQAPTTIATDVNADSNQPLVLAGSPDMAHLVAAYTTTGATAGVAIQKYLASSANWSQPEPVPGSSAAAGAAALPVVAATIDDSAQATVVTPFATSNARWSLWGFREQSNGTSWTRHMLLDWRTAAGTGVGSVGAIVDAHGTVLSGLVHQEGDPQAYQVSIFRFTPKLGWSTETAASYSIDSSVAYSSTATPLAWVGTSGQAVALYDRPVGGSFFVGTSIVGAGNTWRRVAFPHGAVGPIGTSPNGDVLSLGATSEQVSARWLNPD